MTDRFVVESRTVGGPATHVIVIGVGDYPHLQGGSGLLSPQNDGMGQLTSPPFSARAVAKWFIQALYDPSKPLADVALLISERASKPFRNPRTKADLPVATATIDDVEEALTGWHSRGNAREEDRLIFFFCGHGIAAGSDAALLAADYGAKTNNPLDGALDFRNFLQCMDSCAAREQVYFVDACRASSDSLLRAGVYNGRPIFQPGLNSPARPYRLAPVFYSTLAGAAAYGRKGRPSPFTESLIRGLQGAGADDSEGDWRVTTTRLKEALDFYLARATRGLGRAQVPAADNQAPIAVHYVRGTPKATALVACDPPEAIAGASLTCRANGKVRAHSSRSRDEWAIELPAGLYEFCADFPQGPYRLAQPYPAYVRPVYRKIPLKVTP